MSDASSDDKLMIVLRRAAQVELGREDAPLDERAARECQQRGWLDNELQLTPAGREALELSQEKPAKPH
jgi:hypothetical protein